MLGVFDNFPAKIHRIDRFSTKYSSRILQEKLMNSLCKANQRTFSFEEIAYPTMPKCEIMLEAGIAEGRSFNYIDDEEINKVFDTLRKKTLRALDFFFAFRYYKGNAKKKSPLKFDYYMVRVFFSKERMEIRIFHERGPRYITPEDITTFLVDEINKSSLRVKLKRVEA